MRSEELQAERPLKKEAMESLQEHVLAQGEEVQE